VAAPGILVRIACGLAACSALSPAAFGGTFTISPLRVDFAGNAGTAALTVRNEDAGAVVIQADGLAWSQDSGQDALTPTRDLLVSPAVFTLAPGGTQLVRVALRRAADPVRELTYRLVLQEVPPAARPGFTGLQVSLRLSVPVFVAPTAPAQSSLSWSATRTATGALEVTAHNAGAAHARIHRLALKSTAGGAPAAEYPALSYVLAGSTQHWTFDGGDRDTGQDASSAGGGSYRLEGSTDRGPFATELVVASD
jgi:fimbrial chaperone protein